MKTRNKKLIIQNQIIRILILTQMMKISKSRFETKAFLEIIHLEKSKICKIRKMMSKEKNILKNVNKLKNNLFNVK